MFIRAFLAATDKPPVKFTPSTFHLYLCATNWSRHAVVADPLRRRWINLPEPDPVAEQKPRTAPAQPIWEFNIRGARVVARKLPFKNFAVWHSFDPDVREVVERACRGRGWWSKKYRNWVVFDNTWPEVFATLLSADQRKD